MIFIFFYIFHHEISIFSKPFLYFCDPKSLDALYMCKTMRKSIRLKYPIIFKSDEIVQKCLVSMGQADTGERYDSLIL